jgi:membrane protein YqaA with SNARE-associated domain
MSRWAGSLREKPQVQTARAVCETLPCVETLKHSLIQKLQSLPRYALKPWYPAALAFVAFSDYFIFIVPLDALVVGSFMAARERWLRLNFMASLGSTLGACLFALLMDQLGTGFLEQHFPQLLHSSNSEAFSRWLQQYGLWALIAIAILPIYQHPTVAIAALAKVPLAEIFLAFYIGRFVKNCAYFVLIRSAHHGVRRFFRE